MCGCDSCDGLRFATEPIEHRMRRDHIRREHFHGELPLQVDIADLKDDREPACTESSFDDVAVAERPLQAGAQCVELGGRRCRRQVGQ